MALMDASDVEFKRVKGIKGKRVLFNVGTRQKPESLFPAEPTRGVFTSPASCLG